MTKKIYWLGHDCFRLEGEKTVYFDPFKLKKGAKKADLILITHSHFDHLSPADIAMIQQNSTEIVCSADAVGKLSGKIHTMKPGDKLTLQGIEIEAVPAYNTNKAFHPKANRWNGYIITIEGEKIYHAGDTDLIPEMSQIKCDIALLPVSGTYVMTAQEAVKAVETIKPKTAIPMHYGTVVGSTADAEYFKRNASCEVIILKPE
jgi:L-ascorbate metabolism protein UlaG (beta-lactamase superfamily)